MPVFVTHTQSANAKCIKRLSQWLPWIARKCNSWEPLQPQKLHGRKTGSISPCLSMKNIHTNNTRMRFGRVTLQTKQTRSQSNITRRSVNKRNQQHQCFSVSAPTYLHLFLPRFAFCETPLKGCVHYRYSCAQLVLPPVLPVARTKAWASIV